MQGKKLFFFLLLVLFSFKTFSTHIIGGEITYKNLGSNNYEVTLKIYRDCNPGNAIYDMPAYVFVFDNAGNIYTILTLDFPGSTKLPIAIANPCNVVPPSVCVEEAIYKKTVNLPPRAGGYNLVYQRCCRNYSILNIIGPGATGATYMAHLPGPEVVAVNSNPSYKTFPPIALCINEPIIFDHSASDQDGDSLVYELCDPYLGADQNCPKPTDDPSCVQSFGGYADPPPYPFVNWASPYIGAYPLDASPVLSIDPQTGLLTGTPTKLGQFVVGVCVKEYRKGILLSTNKRDFQFNIVSCGPPIATIPTQQYFCVGNTITFGNNTINGSTYFWNFGDPGTSADTSHLITPTYTYTDTGTYNVTLIVNAGMTCADTAYAIYKAHPLLNPFFTVPPAQCVSSNSYNFSAGGSFTSDATFAWNFGSSSTPASSNAQSPSGISFSSPGNHPVKLTVEQYGCSKSYTNNVNVIDIPIPLTTQTDFCVGHMVIFKNQSTYGTSYFWDFGDNTTLGDTSKLVTPAYTYPDTGTYQVMLIAKNICGSDTLYTSIRVDSLLQPLINPVTGQCLENNIFNFNAGGTYGSGATFTWNFGAAAFPSSSNVSNPSGIEFSSPGTYTINLNITENGCSKNAVQNISVYPMPVETHAQPLKQECAGVNIQFYDVSNTGNTLTYLWNFGDGGNSSQANPSHTYSSPGSYDVSLQVIAETSFGCKDTFSFSYPQAVTIHSLPTAFFKVDSPIVSILNPTVRITDESTDAIICYLFFGDGDSSSNCNNVHAYSQPGTYTITQVVLNSNFCSDTFQLNIEVENIHRFFVPNAFTPSGDGLNDIFKPRITGVTDYDFMIFNRWGQLIFETKDINKGWDGTFKGNQCQQEVYVYRIKFTDVEFNKKHDHIGRVTLIR